MKLILHVSLIIVNNFEDANIHYEFHDLYILQVFFYDIMISHEKLSSYLVFLY